MKKYLLLFLCLCLLFPQAACNSQDSPAANDPPPASDGNAAGDHDDAPPSSPDSGSAESPPDGGAPLAFEELTVVDTDACSIKITGIEPDSNWGYTLTAQLENKSADTTFMFSIDSAAVDGVQSDPFFASEIAPGKKANESIRFSDELQEHGVTAFSDIEITFRVYDSNDWTADDIFHETVHIYPSGEEQVTPFVRQPQSDDITLIDDESVSVIVTGFTIDKIWGHTVNLFLVNKTEDEILFSVDEASINGFMADPFYATSVNGGKCCFSSFSWSDSQLAENNISDIDEIEFLLKARKSDDWMGDPLVEQIITLNPDFR